MSTVPPIAQRPALQEMWHLLLPHALFLGEVHAALVQIMESGQGGMRLEANAWPVQTITAPVAHHGGWLRLGSAPSTSLCRLSKTGWTILHIPHPRLDGPDVPAAATVCTYATGRDVLSTTLPLDQAAREGWLERSYRHMDGASQHQILQAIAAAKVKGDPIVDRIDLRAAAA